jgi:hypothetical protein
MKKNILFNLISFLSLLFTTTLTNCTYKNDSISLAEKDKVTPPGIEQTKAIAEEAYIYGFPMIAAYKALYQFNVDKASGQYKGAFNTIINDSQVFTYKDTAIVTPNSDTPYSMVQLDLRAEPIVLCVPKVDKNRYYSVQLSDMYSFNYGYIGSRATGSESGCYLVVGPGWDGTTPKGIKQVFHSETQFGLVIYRTQLFGSNDIANVKKVQIGYKVYPLSKYIKQPAPLAAPAVDWPVFSDAAFKTDFPRFLDFLLQFCPEVPSEKNLRIRFASIGIGAKKQFNFNDLSELHKIEVGLGIKDGFERIKGNLTKVGANINGWRVAAVAGNRDFYAGNFLLRATAALAGIYANDALEATYPLAQTDDHGLSLDGSKYNYAITFPAGGFPPVQAFWSITMYDGKTQLLIKNPINRYLINSPMINSMKKNSDGSLTIYAQNKSPGIDKESNWLPAPNGPIYMVMRLYWPKVTPPSILPAGQGTWSPPLIKQVALE